jgi:hypothetical protein
MTEQELRALVRDAVARHLGHPAHPAPCRSAELAPRPHHAGPNAPQDAPPLHQPHASHSLYVQLVNVSDTCLIEPAVACTHCEYCRSHGH